MFIKDLKKLLDEIETSWPPDFGEPEVMVDVFKRASDGTFTYAGFSKDIIIDYSSDGVHRIINAFDLGKQEGEF